MIHFDRGASPVQIWIVQVWQLWLLVLQTHKTETKLSNQALLMSVKQESVTALPISDFPDCKTVVAQIWPSPGKFIRYHVPHGMMVHSCLTDLLHKQAIARPHVSQEWTEYTRSGSSLGQIQLGRIESTSSKMSNNCFKVIILKPNLWSK